MKLVKNIQCTSINIKISYEFIPFTFIITTLYALTVIAFKQVPLINAFTLANLKYIYMYYRICKPHLLKHPNYLNCNETEF